MSEKLRAVLRGRVTRWVAIALLLNGGLLYGSIVRHLKVRRTVNLWVAASDVRRWENVDTGEVEYEVQNVAAAEVADKARWPDWLQLCVIAGLDMALLAWILRLALNEQRPNPSPPAGMHI
jgi:hypothetical protein